MSIKIYKRWIENSFELKSKSTLALSYLVEENESHIVVLFWLWLILFGFFLCLYLSHLIKFLLDLKSLKTAYLVLECLEFLIYGSKSILAA